MEPGHNTHAHMHTRRRTHAPVGGMSPGQQQQQPEGPPPAIGAAGPEALALLAESKMRCGGCGAKVCGGLWGQG